MYEMIRQVSQTELDRLQRKKGVKLKRKLGTGKKKPEPEKASEAKSGATPAELPVPAPTPPPAPIVDMKPFAAMSASMATSNANIAKLIENNTKVMEDFKTQLAEKAGEVKKRVSWEHTVKRDGFKLMEKIISRPIER